MQYMQLWRFGRSSQSCKNALLVPVTSALHALLLQQLTNQIGMALTGNANQQGALAGLGVLLNPWATNEAHTAIVTIRIFLRQWISI